MLPPILLKLYAVPIDSGSRAVMLFFEQLGVKFQLCKFDENATSELGHLPSGWPILRDNTFYVFEPSTILRYLAQKVDLSQTWYPNDLITRTKIDQFFDWFHNNLKSTSESVLSIVINFNARTCQFNSDTRQPSMDEIAFAIKNYIEVLKEMENIFFKDTLFVVGNTMTIADIQAACQLSFYIVINADLTPFPKLSAWYTRVKEGLKAWEKIHKEYDVFVGDCLKRQKLQQSHDQKIKKKDAAGGTRQPDVYHHVYFQKPPSDVWAMLTSPSVFNQLTNSSSEFSAKPGGKFSYYDGMIEGTNLYLETNKKLLQSWTISDWPKGKNSTVRVNAEASQNGTQLILLQQDIPSHFIKKTDELWNTHFWIPFGGVLVRNVLHQLFFDNLSPHTIYSLLTDSPACTRLTRSKCEIGRGVGSEVSLLDATILGKNVELITDVKIVQQLRLDNWPVGHYCTLTLEISRVAGGTTVLHNQENVPVSCFNQTVELWEKSFWKKMQKWNEEL